MLACIAVLYLSLWPSPEVFRHCIDRWENMPLFGDFLFHFYAQGCALELSGLPVPGYFYSAFGAVLLSGLAKLSPGPAQQLWVSLLCALMVVFYLCGRAWLTQRERLVYAALFGLSVPILHDLRWAQVSTLLNVCILGSYLLYERDRKLMAALLLSVAIAIKLYPALFLLPFLLRRDSRFLILCAAFTLGLFVLLPAGTLGLQGVYAFQRAVYTEVQLAFTTWLPRNPNTQSPGFVFGRSLPSSAVASLLGKLTLLLPLAALALSYRRRALDLRQSYVLLSLMSVLITPTAWAHYFVFLPLALAILLPRNRNYACWILWGGSALLSSMLPLLIFDWYVLSTKGTLCWAGLLALTLSLYPPREAHPKSATMLA